MGRRSLPLSWLGWRVVMFIMLAACLSYCCCLPTDIILCCTPPPLLFPPFAGFSIDGLLESRLATLKN